MIVDRRAALAAVIAGAQRALRTPNQQARFPGASWGDQVWLQSVPGRDPCPMCFVASPPKGNGATLVERLRKLGTPTWPATFADPLRAYLVGVPNLTRTMVESTLATARHFWRFLGTNGRHDDDLEWTWDMLDDATLAQYRAYLGAEAPQGAGLAKSSREVALLQLRKIGDMLYARGACAPLTYTPRNADRRAHAAATRASVVLPPEAVGLVPGVVTPRQADAAAALVHNAKLRWDSDPAVRKWWAPASWDSIVWPLRAGIATVSRFGGVVWSADYVPTHVERTPELVGAYGVTSYPLSYGDVLKSFLLERGNVAAATVWTYTGLWRRFFRFLCDAGLSTADAPWHWAMVTDAQLIGFSMYLRAGYGTMTGALDPMTPQSAALRVMDLRSVCDWLGARGAAPALTVVRVGDELLVQDGVLAPATPYGHRAKSRAAAAAAARVRIVAPDTRPAPALEPRLARVVEKGAQRLATAALRERHPGAEWGHTIWRAVGGGASTTIGFGQIKSRRRWMHVEDALDSNSIDPWPTWYGDPIRAMITERTALGLARVQGILSACRNFWRFLVASKLHSAEQPWSWSRLDDRVLGRYEQYIQEHVGRNRATLADPTIRGNLNAMMTIGRWFASHRVIRTPQYMPVSASATARWRDEDEQRRAGAALLPPRGSLEALSRLYYEITQGTLCGKLNPVDEACVLLLVLLMLTGRRLGELMRLRADCLLYETVRPWQDGWAASEGVFSTVRPDDVPGERVVLRMRYWMEKKRMVREGVIGIMPTAAPVVEACVRRLRELTAPARARAAELEKTPDHFPLPGTLAGKAYLTYDDLELIYPYRRGRGRGRDGVLRDLRRTPSLLERAGLRVARTARSAASGSVFLPHDVAAVMQTVRRRICPVDAVVIPPSGAPQMLSESLFATYYRAGHPKAAPVRALACLLSMNSVTWRFTAAPSPLWRAVRHLAPEIALRGLRSHGFRRWLNSVALHGGAPISVLTRYFGRDQDAQTNAYIYPADMLDLPADALERDACARAEHVKQEIKAGRVYASVALGYFRMLAAEGQEAANAYLDRNLPAAHPTELGHCSRDLATEPCEKHLNCLDACEHYIGTKGDAREIRALSDLAERLAQEGDMLRAMLAMGVRVHADRLPRSERQLAEVQTLLRWHHDPAIPDGTMITKDGPAPRRLPVLT